MNGGAWERVTVVGCGLVGASFALAARRAGVCRRLAGWDVSPAALAEAVRRGVVDEADEAFARGGVSESDLIYLATPVGGIIDFLRSRARRVKAGAVVTDAGSTKREVCRAAREREQQDWFFVGGHPVAGSHRPGLPDARAELFAGAPYVLAGVEDGSDPRALAALAETLGRMGARVRVMSADEHDRALALVSHLPQLVSGALAATVAGRPDAPELCGLAGAGFRDVTRLAASPWGVWRDILSTNPAYVADALDAFAEKLSAVRDELRARAETGAGDLSAARALFDQTAPFEQAPTARRDAGLS